MKAESGDSRLTDVRIEPDAAETIQRAQSRWTQSAQDQRAMTARRELGLPQDRPVVMTGHQATWFHAGIFAKYAACQAIAEQLGGACAWVVPDQDEAAFATIDAPVRTKAGGLQRRTVQLVTAAPHSVAAGSLPPFTMDEISWPDEPALPSVRDGLSALKASLQQHHSAPTAAQQVAQALRDLMAPAVAPTPLIFATRLNQTSVFHEVLDVLASDPEAATAHYNDAAARRPEAHVAPLMRAPARHRYELPLWRLTRGRARQTVFANELASIPREELAPKALLFTGMLRLAACDLFIHGTGGGLYDRITETWLANWLGVTLAPMMTVTATLRLPLADGAVTARDVEAAKMRAHRALHHPAEIGLLPEQQERDALAKRVADAKNNGRDPASEFRALHDFLEQHRARHWDAIDKARKHADALQARLDESDIANDRTWPFFFHSPEALQSLRDAISRRIVAPTEAPSGVT